MTTCNECHGFDLRGSHGWGSSTPDLAMIVGYSQDEFRILMQEGIGIGGRKDLGLMSIVAKDRFAHFSDDEITSLYAFLTSLADQPVPEDVLWRPQD